ncbi:MAG: GAF domain-containing protein [Anaerolineae bacterium]|nr:GAF domain-containing protein [Anaerolineae bacterium]
MMMSVQTEKPRTSRRLTTTLVIAFLALSVVVLLIAGGFQIFFSIRTQQETIADEQQYIAQDAANTVSSFVQEKFSVLEAVAKFGDPSSASQEEQTGILGNLLGLEPAFRHLVLLDSQGRELAKSTRLSEAAAGNLVDRAGSDLFAQVQQGNRYVGSAYIDDLTSEPLAVMAVPVQDVFGDFQGVLLAEVNLKFMWDLVGRLEVGETGLAYVVDRQGNLIAFGDVSRVLRGENVGELREVGEFISNPALVDETGANISTGIDGTTVIGTYVPLGTPDWAVVVELPVAEAYRGVIRGAVISAGVVLVVATLAGLLGVYVARRLAVPLLNLTETATRIAGGETELQAALEGPAEVIDLAKAFNSMTAQLQDLIGGLERRVADRTRNLQTAAEVARVTTSVLDSDELLRQAVAIVRERFGLYYVGLFLLAEEPDDTGRTFAVLRAGTGETGQKMLAQEHRLEVGGDSMIGQCTARGEARIAFDVGEEAVRFDNPLLPETRSEMALPLRSRGRTIGAMTVQSAEEVAFDQEDIAVMQTVVDQVAVAIDNARLFTDAQSALEEMRATQRRYLGRAWAEYVGTAEVTAYDTQYPGRTSLDGGVLPEIQQALERRGVTVLTDRDDHSALVAPLTLRGQVIGALGIHDQDETRQWTDDEIALVETVIARMTLAAENLRLIDETRRRAAREQLIGEVASRMRETLDMDRMLQTAIREIGETLNIAEVEVRMSRGAKVED